jgi:hypothetical protein
MSIMAGRCGANIGVVCRQRFRLEVKKAAWSALFCVICIVLRCSKEEDFSADLP